MEGRNNVERLTSNKTVYEMDMVELAHNSCYIKDGTAWYRDYSVEVDARTLARKLLKDFAEGDDSFTCDEDFEEYITACLEDGTDSIEGLIALLYRNLWAMAELHAHLKYYEDLEEQGKLLKLPCAVGDTVWDVDFGMPYSYEVTGFSFGEMNYDDWGEERVLDQVVVYYTNGGSITGSFAVSEIGKTVFLTREEAEVALRGQ